MGIEISSDLRVGSTATVQVMVDGQLSPPANISIGEGARGIFTTGAAGVGVITHANGTLVNAANPAVAGETVTIYATGLGQVNPLVATGALPTETVTTVATPIVMVDGMQAEMKFSGIASCCVGLNQINVVVPSTVHPGVNVPVVLSVGTQQSNTAVMPTK